MSDKETLPRHPEDKIPTKIVGVSDTLSVESTGVLSDISAAGADQLKENDSKSSDSKESNNNNNNSSGRRGNSKDGKGFFRLSKFLSRNRIIIDPASKEPEEISIDSSNTVKTGSSSVSNESRKDNYSNRTPYRLPSIGSHIRRLMRFKSSQKNVKTNQEQIIVVPSVEAFPVITEDGGISSDFDQRSQLPYTEDYDSKNLDERVAAVAVKLSEISKTTTPVIITDDDADPAGPPPLRSSTMMMEDIVIGNSATTIPLISSTVTIANPGVQQRISGNDTSTMIVVDNFDVTDEANLSGAEVVHVLQADRRNNDAPEIRSDRFIYPQESQESRVEPNVTEDITESRREVERNCSVIGTVGSESISVISEVADPNEQQQQQLSEGRNDDDENEDDGDDDAADQYYNAVLRAVLRRQFRHHDDEPPIY